MRSLKQSITANRRRWKYRRIVNKLLRCYYDYYDMGLEDKYHRVLKRAKKLAR